MGSDAQVFTRHTGLLVDRAGVSQDVDLVGNLAGAAGTIMHPSGSEALALSNSAMDARLVREATGVETNVDAQAGKMLAESASLSEAFHRARREVQRTAALSGQPLSLVYHTDPETGEFSSLILCIEAPGITFERSRELTQRLLSIIDQYDHRRVIAVSISPP